MKEVREKFGEVPGGCPNFVSGPIGQREVRKRELSLSRSSRKFADFSLTYKPGCSRRRNVSIFIQSKEATTCQNMPPA